MEHEQEFLDISKGMVSNVFWNSDKQFRQKAQAEKIANMFDYIHESEIEKFHIWIKCFLLEFIKKWPKIDFLRLDKYIMLTQTIIRKYFDYNLKNNKHTDSLRIFNYIVLAITSGFYNYNFISNVLKNIGYIIDEFFKDENFKNSPNNEFFSLFTEKLIELFLTIRDKREINSFKENLFNKIDSIMINDSFYRESDLKKLYQKKIFEKATSKEEIPEPQRTMLFKVYKKNKYNDENYEEKEKENIKTYDVDPVNDYILKKNYTNRTRLTKIEKMRLLANRRKFHESNQKQLKEMEKEKMKKLTNEINKNFDNEKEKSKETKKSKLDDITNLELNSDENLKGKKININNKDNNPEKKEKEKEKKITQKPNESNQSDSKELSNNDTFSSDKEKSQIQKEEPKEEILTENIIKLDDEEITKENNNNKKVKKQKENLQLQSQNNKQNKDQKQKPKQIESDSEDMELEEDSLDNEENENEEDSYDLEENENEELEEGEEPLDYDEELEYDDGEEYEFEEEDGLMDYEEMDFLEDEENEFDEEMDLEEEEYYNNIYGKSLSSIYSKIQAKQKEKQKNLPPKTQEEIEMQKSLIEARNNSIKNAMLKTSANNNNFMLGKKRNKGLLFNGNENNNNGSNNNGNENNNKNGNKKNHQGNNMSKKKVNFIMNKNTVNRYEQLKPIILTSNKRTITNNGSPVKGLLKKKENLK